MNENSNNELLTKKEKVVGQPSIKLTLFWCLTQFPGIGLAILENKLLK